jgi:hypothetical protein
MSTDRNMRLPKPAWSDPDSGITPQYPYIYGQRDNNGGYSFTYRHVGDYTLSSSETYHPSGSYETIQYHPETGEIRTRFNRGDEYVYNLGGLSQHITGHLDQSVSSTSRTNVTGDQAVHVGRNRSVLTSGQSIEAGGPSIRRAIPGSDTKTYNSSGGDVVNEHSGNFHEAFQKDLVTSVTKNAVFMVNQGDYAVHVQTGSYDSYVKEKTRLFAENDIMIESKTKITLKVGNSTIVITHNSIDIDSQRIDLN